MVLITCNGIQREVAEADLQRWLEKGYAKVEVEKPEKEKTPSDKKKKD